MPKGEGDAILIGFGYLDELSCDQRIQGADNRSREIARDLDGVSFERHTDYRGPFEDRSLRARKTLKPSRDERRDCRGSRDPPKPSGGYPPTFFLDQSALFDEEGEHLLGKQWVTRRRLGDLITDRAIDVPPPRRLDSISSQSASVSGSSERTDALPLAADHFERTSTDAVRPTQIKKRGDPVDSSVM
jgi:hypothetical protein